MPIFTAPMAAIEQVKDRLGVASSDTSLDAVLQEALEAVSAEIEQEAGRRLRRSHRVTEYVAGGTRLIELKHFPIANIESIRESDTRDFETEGAYTELIEGTDYILEPVRAKNESGIIRRLDQEWMGSERDPGKVRIIYTGGYKTPTELALENKTITIQGSTHTKDFTVQRSQNVDPEYYARDFEDAEEIKFKVGEPADAFVSEIAIVRFDLTQTGLTVLPAWQIIEGTLTAAWRKDAASAGGVPINVGLISEADPLQGVLGKIWLASKESLGLADNTLVSNDFEDFTVALITSEEARTIVQQTAGEGYIAFAFYMDETDDANEGVFGWLKSSDATEGTRPSLELKYQNQFADTHSMPDDLRNACLIQTIHEFQRRVNPGRLQASMRGITIASGSLEMFNELDLLPGVKAVARSYRRKY